VSPPTTLRGWQRTSPASTKYNVALWRLPKVQERRGVSAKTSSPALPRCRKKLAIADKFFLKDSNIFAETKYDVNGKPVTGSKIMFDGYPASAKSDQTADSIYNKMTFSLTLARDGVVTAMAVDFPKDPTFARTQDEYDATGLYQVVSAITAKACPTLSKLEVAKWFENAIKPGQRVGPRTTWSEPESGHARDITAKKTSLCGRSFEFLAVYGTYHEGFQRQDFGGMKVTVR